MRDESEIPLTGAPRVARPLLATLLPDLEPPDTGLPGARLLGAGSLPDPAWSEAGLLSDPASAEPTLLPDPGIVGPTVADRFAGRSCDE